MEILALSAGVGGVQASQIYIYNQQDDHSLEQQQTLNLKMLELLPVDE